jgi:glycosyltransferase involved in cell wall biosynthesis/GT2 family glycosyltransferase
MDRPPEVSVVVPCFNDGRFLADCLKSVSDQTLPPLETLIVDDGSTHNSTKNILRRLNRPGVRIIHQENRGLAGARNTGIRNAKGRYIYFLDADNILFPDCLAKLSALLEENRDAIAAYSRIRFLSGPDRDQDWGELYNPYVLLTHNQWDAGILLRAQAVPRYDLWYDESMRHGYEDWEFHIRLTKIGEPILFCPEALYGYRVRRKSLLSTSHSRHAEIVKYIKTKHDNLFGSEHLLNLKRTHAPSVKVRCSIDERPAVLEWLKHQTFQDWVLDLDPGQPRSVEARYEMHICAGTDALERLPLEALDAAIMNLESDLRLHHTVIAVKNGRRSWLASGGKKGGLYSNSLAIALIIRASAGSSSVSVEGILKRFESLAEFPDQRPDSVIDRRPVLSPCSENLEMLKVDRETLRRYMNQWGKWLLRPGVHARCMRLYDTIHGVLASRKSFAFRKLVRRRLGPRVEEYGSKIVFGLFLMHPPLQEETVLWKEKEVSLRNVRPFFIHASRTEKIKVLVATAWLTEGGVDQIVLDLCRLLDPSRFQVTVVTTLASAHPWDHWARKAGVSVYHLADFLKPAALPRGLAHLVLNLKIDCLYIFHSRAAYDTVGTLRQMAPWLTVIDRNEVVDPDGGFPRISGSLNSMLLDLRTVSHQGLADYMYERYKLPPDSLRVIYAGTDLRRIEKARRQKCSLLHKMCKVSVDTPIVVFAGRLTAQKRPETFVRSVARMFEIDRSCSAHIAIVGDGERRNAVADLVSRHSLGKRVHMLGAHANAVDLLAGATLVMLPSAYEGLALVSYEAMALGIPQIFANVNGQSELITPETGILIDNGLGEEDRYAKACLELLRDRERRIRIAAAGRDRIKSHFTAENAVKQYAQIFEDLTELSRKRESTKPYLTPPHIDPLHDLC